MLQSESRHIIVSADTMLLSLAVSIMRVVAADFMPESKNNCCNSNQKV
jgi:hypothetical protein